MTYSYSLSVKFGTIYTWDLLTILGYKRNRTSNTEVKKEIVLQSKYRGWWNSWTLSGLSSNCVPFSVLIYLYLDIGISKNTLKLNHKKSHSRDYKCTKRKLHTYISRYTTKYWEYKCMQIKHACNKLNNKKKTPPLPIPCETATNHKNMHVKNWSWKKTVNWYHGMCSVEQDFLRGLQRC